MVIVAFANLPVQFDKKSVQFGGFVPKQNLNPKRNTFNTWNPILNVIPFIFLQIHSSSSANEKKVSKHVAL